MKPKPWNKLRLALYGAVAGLLIGLLTEGGAWLAAGFSFRGVGMFVGNEVVTAILVAIVSNVCNFVVIRNAR